MKLNDGKTKKQKNFKKFLKNIKPDAKRMHLRSERDRKSEKTESPKKQKD